MLAMGNNVNEQGFSIDEYMNFTGGSQAMMGGGGVRLSFNSSSVPLNFGNRANGLMKNYAGGINFNNDFSKKTQLNSSYFYNYLDHNISQITYRENRRETGDFIFNQDADQHNTNGNHRLNLTLDHKIDSINSLKLTTSFGYNETDSESTTNGENITAGGEVINTSAVSNVASGNTLSLNNNLLLRHKFKKKGRTISANLTFNLSQSDRDGLTFGEYEYFGDDPRVVTQDQVSTQAIGSYTYGGNVSYTEPLGGRKYLEASYNYSKNLNDVDRKVFDVLNGEETYNPALSNVYNSDYTYNRPGLNFRLNRTNYNLMVGAGVQYTNLSGDVQIMGDIDHIDRSFQNVLPAVRFNYDFSNTKHFEFEYETSVREPSIQQLNPNLDQSDLLNLYQGNPNLRPAYNQSWQLRFNTFNPVNFLGFFSNFGVEYTTNSITNSVTIDEDLKRTTTPVNVDHNMSMNGNATVSVPVNKIKSRFSLGVNGRRTNSINFVDEEESDVVQQTFGGTFRYNYRYKEIFELNLGTTLSHQNTDYEFDQQDQTFLNQTYRADGNLTFLKKFQLNGELEYLVYESKSTNFRQDIPLLNISISRFVLKNNAGELKFAVNNLMDKALGVSQTTSINYLERNTTNSLGRYFMLSFTYAINKHLNPMGGRRGGMRFIRGG
ncbi:MAG: TonB-dependent receptor [Bacteroidia bacterium]|nr:TonB-dependent receptor [Bacteroidia bacterium]